MNTKNLNEIYTTMSLIPNILLDINEHINTNKMKVFTRGDILYITKNTHHKFKTYITYTPQKFDVTSIDEYHHIIQNDLEIDWTIKKHTFWITTRTTYLQFLSLIKLGNTYLPKFKQIIIKL